MNELRAPSRRVRRLPLLASLSISLAACGASPSAAPQATTPRAPVSVASAASAASPAAAPTPAQPNADSPPPSSGANAVARWKAQGGVLVAAYERLRAEEGAIGAAVLVAEGAATSSNEPRWFVQQAPKSSPRPIRRGRPAALVARAPLEVQPVNVASLERIVVPAAIGNDELAAIAKAGFTGLGLRGAPFVRRGASSGDPAAFTIHTERTALAHLRVAQAQSGGALMGAGEEHALFLACRPESQDALSPARWQTATPRAEGMEVVISDGWFQDGRCRAGLIRSTAAMARPLDDAGLVYGLRACESEACAEPSLLLVVPRAISVIVSGKGAVKEQGGATFVRLPIRAGSTSTMLARMSTAWLVDWDRTRVAAGLPSTLGTIGSDLPAGLQIGVDVVFAAGEPAPEVLFYRSSIAPVVR